MVLGGKGKWVEAHLKGKEIDLSMCLILKHHFEKDILFVHKTQNDLTLI